MPFVQAIRLSIRAKVLLLALGLALPPLVIVSLLGLSSLDTARETARQVSTDALRDQAVSNLKERAADKARLYTTTLENVKQQVEGVSAYASALEAGDPPSAAAGRVWISPDGPSPASEQAHADTVARARQFIPLLASVVQRNPLIELGYIGLEDGGVVAFDHDIVDVLAEIKPFDVRTRPWYIKARDAGHTVWTDLYVDANTKKLTITCATPFYNDRGEFVGVVGFDVLLDTIKQDILQLDMGPAGYAFLINDQGEYLVQPDIQDGEVNWNDSVNTE
jgi:two-component system, sensor histidine kinase and response regulator